MIILISSSNVLPPFKLHDVGGGSLVCGKENGVRAIEMKIVGVEEREEL